MPIIDKLKVNPTPIATPVGLVVGKLEATCLGPNKVNTMDTSTKSIIWKGLKQSINTCELGRAFRH